MASRLGLMIKQEQVDNRIRSVTNRLKSRGVDVGTYPDETRDRNLRAYQRQEHTADLLESCLARIEELGGEKRSVEAGSTSDTGATNWNAHTVKDLKKIATENEVQFPSKATKPELVALLEQWEQEQSPADDSEESEGSEGDEEPVDEEESEGAPSSGWGQ
jgi:hypothetical protein